MRGLHWESSSCTWTNYWDNPQGLTLAVSAACALLPPKISGKERTVECSMISRVKANRLSKETFLILCTGRSLLGVANHHCYSWLPSDYIPTLYGVQLKVKTSTSDSVAVNIFLQGKTKPKSQLFPRLKKHYYSRIWELLELSLLLQH